MLQLFHRSSPWTVAAFSDYYRSGLQNNNSWRLNNRIIAMNQHEQSETNESIFSTEECLELRKRIALASSELIQLVSDEKKFNSKLQQLNRMACNLIDQDKYLQASVYLDEAEKVLEYAAGCGKAIERSLITTILNNQACLLQRTSQFEQSANYLQAIIFNISEYVEGCHTFEFTPNYFSPESSQFAELATYFERKLSLALYNLRYCALISHAKNNELALKSAKIALKMLKEICAQQYNYQQRKETLKKLQLSSEELKAPFQSQKENAQFKKLLKNLSNIITVSERQIGQFLTFKEKCISCINDYNKRLQNLSPAMGENAFQSFSIGNLMQASPLPLTSKNSATSFIDYEFSLKGKSFKVVYLAMAHFTVATELRLISASKYSLDEDQRKSSPQFRQSKIYHLTALILLSRYLSFKSVFFDHAVSSFKNHYGIDLLSQVYFQVAPKDFSILNHDDSKQQIADSISNLEEIHTNEDQIKNQSIQIHQERLNTQPLSINLYKSEYQDKPQVKLMKQIQNQKPDTIKFKHVKSKAKNQKHWPISFSRALDSERNMLSKNKQNKSKSKMILSKGKETLKSRQRALQTQETCKALYYGFQGKSRSKSKKPILQRKTSKKSLTTKSGLVFQNRKLKNETKVEEQYGVKSGGNFGLKTIGHANPIKLKTTRASGLQQQNPYNHKSSKAQANENAKMKKVKSPLRSPVFKNEPIKRKSMSKDKYW